MKEGEKEKNMIFQAERGYLKEFLAKFVSFWSYFELN